MDTSYNNMIELYSQSKNNSLNKKQPCGNNCYLFNKEQVIKEEVKINKFPWIVIITR